MNYLSYKVDWMRVYNSPFKLIIPKLYIGKITIGTPYFYPRVWKKYTRQEAIIKAVEELNKNEEMFKLHKVVWDKGIGFDKLYYKYSRSRKAVPKKIGFDFVPLGWKTKWDEYRHECNPIWSFVFFKWQIALTFTPKHDAHYWECWLYYSRETKGATKERIKQARKDFPCIWTSTENGVEIKTDYWDKVLKNKFIKT
jgi:hypothetical protein